MVSAQESGQRVRGWWNVKTRCLGNKRVHTLLVLRKKMMGREEKRKRPNDTWDLIKYRYGRPLKNAWTASQVGGVGGLLGTLASDGRG